MYIWEQADREVHFLRGRKQYIFDKQRSNRKKKREGVRKGTKVKREKKDCRGVHIYKTRVYAGV